MTDQGTPDDERQVFLDSLVGGSAAHLTLCPGVTASGMQAGTRQGLALLIARETLQASQLQQALERRFEQAVAFDGCFIYIDPQDNLVIWHALPSQRNLLERTLSRMLSLANLETLDARTRR
ncbi:transcriptional regulator [Pseudomonas haemolytica]|uniref:Transcriptional regulator n=1 Tax=Pseudomonas haemolytica TaxID=2600065 RepID=A0A5P1D6L8_9PSED|nr:transcriptional regulator [Pseudomonas haemolytica]MBJ2244743.1 transcriptional regulator [Pseudomonas haemolytica]MBJ2271403.1 transcriptional regulator [Pseudomonas haemolytica]MBK3447467.1 transcriptional regulator [Pseudomonas haemolytica]MBK3459727.1 transcriptional regulator [Pseudomonas haemolytica]MRJ35409.1 transcriptional regulator [Pseudomonas haemolytica]